jgi:hypothetical protein
MKSKNDGALIVLTVLVATVGVVLLPTSVSYLWWWFVVPLGAPPIGIMHAFGLAILWNMLSAVVLSSCKTSGPKREYTASVAFAETFTETAKPAAALVFGYVAHLLVMAGW